MVSVIFKGGRLPSWHALRSEEQDAYSQEHVDLMLRVAEEHRLQRIEGFRLIGRQGSWERFWIIEVPTVRAAETWIQAEMAPPYGRYGYYEYHLSRPKSPKALEGFALCPVATEGLTADAHEIPSLAVDPSSLVTIIFERELAESVVVAATEGQHVKRLQAVASEHGLMRYERFELLTPQAGWHRVWVNEFPTLAGGEAWIDAQTSPERSMHCEHTTYLARKWAPEYFATWSRA